MITLKLNAKYNDEGMAVLEKYRHDQSQALSFILKRVSQGEDVSKPKNEVQQHVMGCWASICCKAYESLVINAKRLVGQAATRRRKDIQKLESLEHDLNNLDPTFKNYANRRWRLTRKIQIKKSAIDGNYGVCLGGSRNLSEYNRYLNLGDVEQAEIWREKYLEARLQPYQMIGAAGEGGNRKFDFRRITEGVIVWTPIQGTRIDILVTVKSREHRRLVKKLEDAVKNNLLPISVKLTDTHACLSFDEDILNGTAFDEKAYKAASKKLKEEGEVETQKFKDLKASYHREQECRLRETHETDEHRVLSVDLNPEAIGFSILEASEDGKDYRVLKTFGFKLNHRKLGANQRKYCLSVIYAYAFRIGRHYRCGTFAMEDLDFKPSSKEANSTEFNRITKNLWNRTLQEQLIQKHCTRNGLVLKKVIPSYSSFVGNIIFTYWDPISAACEIGRRGLIQSKVLDAPWYPNAESLLKSDRAMDLSEVIRIHGESVPSSMYDLYKLVRKALWKYRRPPNQGLTLNTLKCTLVHF